MGKTKVTNNAGFSVRVQEGHSNIYRNLRVLAQGSSMTIHANRNATFREYVLILLPDNKKLRPLTSDDIEELDAIEIFYDKDKKTYDWRAEKLPKSFFSSVWDSLFSKTGGAKAPNADAHAGSSESPGTAPQEDGPIPNAATSMGP